MSRMVQFIHSWKDKRETIVFALIFLGSLLLYWHGLAAPFILDDFPSIVDNPAIKHLDLAVIWKHDPSRFLTNLTFAVNYALHGLSLPGWHMINVLLHGAAAVCVFLTTQVILQSPALKSGWNEDGRFNVSLAVSVLFLVHPLQTQAVIYVVQRATLLATCFYLLSVMHYLRARMEDSDKNYALALVFAFLGMISKPLIITLPVMIVAADVLVFGAGRDSRLKSILVVVVMLAMAVLIPAQMIGMGQLGMFAWEGLSVVSWPQRIMTEFNAVVYYLRLFVLPVGLNVDYDFPLAKGLLEFPTLMSAVCIVAIWTAGVFMFRRFPLVSLGIAWFFIALSPVIIFPFKDLVFEHWVYLPSFGFFLGIVVLVIKLLKDQRAAVSVFVCAVAALSVLTWSRVSLWSDPLALMEDTVRKSPGKARVHNNFGLAVWDAGRREEAKAAFMKAIQLDSDYAPAYNNLGSMYLEEKNFTAARDLLQTAGNKTLSNPEIYVNLGNAYEGLGDLDGAVRYYQFALMSGQENPAAYVGLGNALHRSGRLEKAKQLFQKAIWLQPESAVAYYNLGNVFFSEKNFFDALTNYEKSLELDNTNAGAYMNSGYIYYYFGDNRSAVEMFRSAVKADPSSAEAYLNLANALHADGRKDESTATARKALELYKAEGNTARIEELRKVLEQL